VPPGTLKPACDRQGNASVKVQQPGSGEGLGRTRRSCRRGRAADLVEADQVECNVLDPVEQAVEFAVAPG
jgi:hypothetical protein